MRLYISSIKAFMNLNGMNLVTFDRKRDIHASIQAEDKARCLVSGLLLRRVCGITDDAQLDSGENGKPYLEKGGRYFNLARSGDYVVLATAATEVGVDIEKVFPYSDELAVRCFTYPEREWMRKEGGDEAFYRLWTAKESVMKGSGLGSAMPPEEFCVLPLDASAHRIAGGTWFLDWLFYKGHMICRAVENERSKTTLITVTARELLEG